MPIRINLLAEAQAAEELRRRDPVKRMIFCAALLVALILVWSSSLQLKAMLAKKDVSDQQTEIQTHTNEFQQVQADQKKMADVKAKLDSLNQMTASRFLQGNLLNALQKVNVAGVQLMRIKVDQFYTYTEGGRAQTVGTRVVPGRSGTVREKIIVSLDARDSSANPGDQVNKFKQAIADETYFKTMLSKTNGVQLTYLSPSQVGPDGKAFVLFNIECNFPENTR
ncbi:MAG: hypothetical protein WAO02_11825 [Verrucomicrobiia bacterium]